MATEEYYGQRTLNTPKSDFNTLTFLAQQLINKLATVTLVRVVNVHTPDDPVEPVGLVDIQPLVNQMTGNNVAVPHGIIHNVPYFRLQGGTNAVIIDPKENDLGLAAFASRDISVVRQTKTQANPGSLRKYDWADALYFGGFLNGAPEQYVRFYADGIELISPTRVRISAPEVVISASTKVTIDAPTNDIKGGGTSIDGKPFLPHTHGGVQTGGGTSGPVS